MSLRKRIATSGTWSHYVYYNEIHSYIYNLYSIGYEDYLSRGGDLIKWDDGNYGDSTELSVMVFQDNENLKSDGIVDAETLNKLIKKYKESNNE